MSIRLTKLLFVASSVWYAVVPILLPDGTLAGYMSRVFPVVIFILYGLKCYIGYFLYDNLSSSEIYLSLILLLGLYTNFLLRFDIDAVISYISFFGGLYGIYKVSNIYSIKPDDILISFIFVVIPIKISLEKLTSFEANPAFSLIPFRGDNWRVVIQSIHFTGVLGAITFFASLVRLKEGGSRRYLISAIFSVYLVVFSGSRSSLAAIIVVLVIFSFDTAKSLISQSYTFSFFSVILSMWSLYIISILISGVSYSGGFIADLLKLSSEDVTAGRLLTWSYHWDLFVNNYSIGVPASLVQEPSYFDPKLAASNESYYTRILARYGVWSIVFYATFVYLGLVSSFKKNWISFAFLIMMCIITSGQGIFGGTYNLFPLLSWWFFFSLLKSH